MSRQPRAKGPYELSKLYHSSPVSPTWQNYGIDGSNNGRDILWIGHGQTGFILPFKAFTQDLKLNLTKDIEFSDEKDKWGKVYKETVGDMTFDLSLKIPAHSVNESRNNLAKIEALQNLLLDSPRDMDDEVLAPFYVFMRNLVNSGRDFGGTLPNINSFSQVKKHGFPCYLEKITFEPDLDMGFFEYDSGISGEQANNFPFPKVITLNLTLNYDANSDITETKPIKAFTLEGKYAAGDNKFFPFLSKPKETSFNKVFIENLAFLGTQSTYIYIVRNGNKVLFPGFIDSFKRDYATNQYQVENKNINVGRGRDHGIPTTPKKLSYLVEFNIPSRNTKEAEFNCYQIQKLMRMFYRPFDENETGARGQPAEIYIPGFIEKGGAPRAIPDPISQQNSLGRGLIKLNFETMNLDIISDSGFFEDSEGKMYPKTFKISIELSSDGEEGDDSTIHPYEVEKLDGGKVKITNDNYLFPFNRKTVRFK